ncbi:MAG: hypothetical protein GT600_00440 [Bacteroidales bacterium]|jgi:hypothetical protein|nr:hypothetical protein [Bacteroidales bacterium]HPY66818.1 hypothetical protein [Bacteroidales bacterium]HQB35954.1 hypothetical protein [Bacteroidales bacterium]
MKRLALVISIMLSFSTLTYSQLSGDGSPSNPYSGSITGHLTWASPSEIFADNLTILSGGSLTISPGLHEGTFLNMVGGDLTIESGGSFTLNPNTAATILSITNNGSLILESNSNEAGVASLIHDGYSGSGTSQMKLYLSGGTTPGGVHIWHYISVPMNGIAATSFGSLDLAQYIESLATSTSNSEGWVAYDGYQYSSDSYLSNTFSTLELGKGYNYYSASGTTFTLSGQINIGTVTKHLPCDAVSSYEGFNLLGNPFSSCIDWDYMYPHGYLRSVNNAIYFTLKDKVASYVSGIGSDGGTGFIPPLQGFFVQVNATNGRVIIPPGARTHQFDQLRYKKADETSYISSDTISYVRIKLENSVDSTDIVVRFNKKASIAFDPALDAYEFSKTAGDINLWSIFNDIDYSINGLPFPESKIEIPLGINNVKTGILILSASEIRLLDNYSVNLKDIKTNTTIDLKKGERFTFNADAGITENRFILSIANLTTDVPEIVIPEKKFKIYSSFGSINIVSLTDEYGSIPGSVTIYDLTGRKILQKNNLEWNGKGDLNQIVMNSAEKGLFIIELKSGNKKHIEKVNISR